MFVLQRYENNTNISNLFFVIYIYITNKIKINFFNDVCHSLDIYKWTK